MPLKLARNTHYLNNAFALAHLAAAAYLTEPGEYPSFAETGMERVETFSDRKTDTFGFVAASDKHVVLAFRGTDQVPDWLTNLQAQMRPEPALGAKVHKGFAEALDLVWDRMFGKLEKLWTNGQTFWVTGHSLGGALATLAVRWLPDDWKPFAVCTYGQPRVGDLDFARGYKQRHFRFVNNNDLVPAVPPRFLPFHFPPAFYTHVKQLEFFNGRGRLVARSDDELGITPALVEHLSTLSSREARAEALVLAGLEDHKITNYIACIEKNMPG